MNNSQAQREVFVSLPGIMEQYLPPELRGRPKDFFTYGVNFLPIAAGTAATQTVQINTDADFLMVMATALARDDADDTDFPNPPLTVQLESTGSGRLFSNVALDFDTFYGTAQLPFVLPYPKVLDAGAQLSTRLTHFAAAPANLDVRVAYHGVKIFPR